MSNKIRVDPEFERYCLNLKRDVEKSLKEIVPNKNITIKNTQIQRIIANINKEDGMDIRIKKIGKRNRYKLLLNEKQNF